MIGVILSGGKGTRLYPSAMATPKQLMPVYDKPMIYYPLTTLMQAECKRVVVVTSCSNRVMDAHVDLLDSAKDRFGVEIRYSMQPEPTGIADGLRCAWLNTRWLDHVNEASWFESADSPVVLVLGDNLFHGGGMDEAIRQAVEWNHGCAVVFGYRVADPRAYGVVETDEVGRAVTLEEKPHIPRSDLAVPGFYYYPSYRELKERIEMLRPSARGELEITDLNKMYMAERRLQVIELQNGTAWLDTGNPDEMLEASEYVRTIQKRQGVMVGCPEEVAFDKGWIDKKALNESADLHSGTEYGRYLERIANR